MKVRWRSGILLAVAFSLGASLPAGAVPLPWKNCGTPGDAVAFSKVDVSVWPPSFGPPSFLYTVANIDPDNGILTKLRAALPGLGWLFELKNPVTPRPGSPVGRSVQGFVALPDSWLTTGSPPMSFVSTDTSGFPTVSYMPSGASGPLTFQSLPIAAGPFNVPGITFPSVFPGGDPETLATAGNVATPIDSMTATAFWNVQQSPGPNLSGFPVPAANQRAGAYEGRIAITESNGDPVLCADFVQPASPLVVVQPIPFQPAYLFDLGPVTFVGWQYTDSRRTVASAAMAPALYYRPCGTPASANTPAKGYFSAQYDRGARLWSFVWNTQKVPNGCYDLSVTSPLTGQTDGPVGVQLRPFAYQVGKW
jgi:hypothetical protein